MPFSIQTKDGIKINNIPDNVDPNSNILRQRIADIRAQRQVQPRSPVADQLAQEREARNLPGNERSFGEKVRGAVDAGASVARKIVAEPIAGIATIQAAQIGGLDAARAARDITREVVGFNAVTPEGKEAEQKIGETLAPVAEGLENIENTLGDKAFQATGSPAVAAAAKSAPTAIAEILGFGLAKGGIRTGRSLKTAGEEASIFRAINEAAPSAVQLKNTSRQIYKEIDDFGVTINANSYGKLVEKIKGDLQSNGLDPQITPKAFQALKRLEEKVGSELTLSELDTLRKVAKSATSSLENAEKALGNSIIDSIDNFLDNADAKNLNGPAQSLSQIGERYKVARNLWGRARRSELLDDAVKSAREQASGFENGIRIQFRQIIKNKKLSKFFTKEELAEMQKVVRGTKSANLARLFGKLGFTDGQTSNLIGGTIGGALGGAAFGVEGVVVVPIIGFVSKKLAENLTKNNAKFANQVIRAGKDARKITKAYFDNVPKDLRTPDELSQLLMQQDIDLDLAPKRPLIDEAVKLAKERRVALGSAAVTGSSTNQVEN